MSDDLGELLRQIDELREQRIRVEQMCRRLATCPWWRLDLSPKIIYSPAP